MSPRFSPWLEGIWLHVNCKWCSRQDPTAKQNPPQVYSHLHSESGQTINKHPGFVFLIASKSVEWHDICHAGSGIYISLSEEQHANTRFIQFVIYFGRFRHLSVHRKLMDLTTAQINSRNFRYIIGEMSFQSQIHTIPERFTCSFANLMYLVINVYQIQFSKPINLRKLQFTGIKKLCFPGN